MCLEGKLMVRSLHPDANAILARLKREGMVALYHFTSVENLPGICQMQALCSKGTLKSESGTLPVVTGGNPLSHSLDRYRGNWDKVSLNLTPSTAHPDKQAWKRHVQAELLVPDRIPLDYMSRVYFVSNASKKYAEQICGELPHPKFE